MTIRSITLGLGLLVSPLVAIAAGTVTLRLESPQDGLLVAPGATIVWTIRANVSANDNEGLAGLLVDLTQSPANPALFDIPAAVGTPAGMDGFASPAGITNPAGYGGAPLGSPGAQDRAQIGGMQNTFGEPGVERGLDVDVDGGVGQGPAGQIIASGAFAAPATLGAYSFSLAAPIANTLDAVHAAPQPSQASAAGVNVQKCCISFDVGAPPSCPGDLDGDLDVDLADLSLLLGDYGASGADLPGDLDGDGTVALTDLSLLLGAFGTTCR